MTVIVKANGAREASDNNDAMIRVDQAGEFGATRIYEGQLAVMGSRAPDSAKIRRMADQEARHREAFDRMLAERGVRPTMLQPLWNVAGFGLGAVTALIGPKAAMACTVAVETEIDRHYSDQLDRLRGGTDSELTAKVEQFREEELQHKAEALEARAEEAPAYNLISGAIRLGCRLAIGLSKRI